MKKLFALLYLYLVLFAVLCSKAYAYTDNGDGTVTLEYGDSYGSVAADLGMNYMELGNNNGCNPHDVVVHPGDVINVGGAVLSAESHMCDNTGIYYGSEEITDYTYTESKYSGMPAYNDYSEEYSYTDDCGNYSEGYTTLCADGSRVDYGTTYVTTNDYSVVDTGSVSGSASIPAGYYGNAGVNVARACELNTNIIIPAGGTYRASDYIGAGDAAMGFLEADCLNSDGTIFQAYGGGICPVTTTIYQAGRDAGLDVVARSPHQGGDNYTCSYAPRSEDQAMYNYGSSDLVMVNNTGSDLVLNCSYSDGVITAAFNG